MLGNITIGQYFPGESKLHRLDARVKILLTIALIVAVFVAKTAVGYALLFLFTALCVYLSGIHVKFMLRGLKPIWFIIVFTFALNLFLGTGETVLFTWKFLTITREGMLHAFRMAIRLTLLILTTQLMTLTTSPIALTDGLESLLKPLSKIGFPAHELAMMMSIALRFIPTLLEETDKIMRAQMARGADFETGNVIRRAKAMLPILVPLFVSAFRRADELALAMEARCYRGGQGRTRMYEMKLHALDGWAALCAAALLAAVIVL